MNLNSRYRLADGIAIRPERFGGLAYSYYDRRLFFLHSHSLTAFARDLNGTRPLGEAIEAFREDNQLPATAGEAMLRSLAALERIGIVVPA